MALPATIRPPFGPRECRDGALDFAGIAHVDWVTSTPSEGATDWIAANWPVPADDGGIPNDCHSLHARRDLLEQLQPFCAQCRIRTAKPVALPPGRDRLSTRPAPTGSTAYTNTIGTVRVACSIGAHDRSSRGQDDVRRERDQFRCVFSVALEIACAKAVFDPHVVAVGPTQLLQPLLRTPRCVPVILIVSRPGS